MKTDTHPLAVPCDLLREVPKAAHQTGLSLADTMPQSMELGLPKPVEQLSPDPLKNLKPFSQEECRWCFQKLHPEFDAWSAHWASLIVAMPDEA
jgi:hypothetical protein